MTVLRLVLSLFRPGYFAAILVLLKIFDGYLFVLRPQYPLAFHLTLFGGIGMSALSVEVIAFRAFVLRACSFAGSALYVYDYALTLGMEVELVWWSKWNAVKLQYIVQRYMPFVDSVVLPIYFTMAPVNDRVCGMGYRAMGWMYIVGISLSEILLTWRAWAVWKKDKRLTYALPIFFVLLWVPNFWFLCDFLNGVTLASLPDYGLFCLIQPGNRLLAKCFILLSVYEACILVLMLIPGGCLDMLCGDSDLMKAVYQDGALFFLCLLTLSMTNVIVIYVLPLSFANLLSCLVRVVHSALTSRVVLHIRRQYQTDRYGDVEDWQDMALPSFRAGPCID